MVRELDPHMLQQRLGAVKQKIKKKKKNSGDFPGGPEVKNLPANAADMGLIRKIPHATEELNPWATTTESMLQSPCSTKEATATRVADLQQRRPIQCSQKEIIK